MWAPGGVYRAIYGGFFCFYALSSCRRKRAGVDKTGKMCKIYICFLNITFLLNLLHTFLTDVTKKKGCKNMKKARLLTGAMLMVLFTVMNPVCIFAAASKIDGHLDSIVGNSISGWIWDSEAPEESQTVSVTVTNRATGETAAAVTVTADEYRDDLEGKGTGYYGFHAAVEWDALPEAHYTVSISADGITIPGTLQYTVGTPAAIQDKNLVSLGDFRLTSYCPCKICSEGWGRRTSSGALATANHTVAVDPRVIPIGSRLLINGQEYVAEDIGGAVKGKHIDVFYNTHAETRQNGTTTAEVFLIK